MSEFLCWSCGTPIRGSATNRKAVPDKEREVQQKAGTPISDDARITSIQHATRLLKEYWKETPAHWDR